jgi:hypothetical protein
MCVFFKTISVHFSPSEQTSSHISFFNSEYIFFLIADWNSWQGGVLKFHRSKILGFLISGVGDLWIKKMTEVTCATQNG